MRAAVHHQRKGCTVGFSRRTTARKGSVAAASAAVKQYEKTLMRLRTTAAEAAATRLLRCGASAEADGTTPPRCFTAADALNCVG